MDLNRRLFSSPSGNDFSVSQIVRITAEADSVVTANHASALRTFPLIRFSLQKALNATLLDEYRVLYHTHMVKSAVPLIERPKAPAWKITALIAEADETFGQQVTLFAHEYAVLATWPATDAVRLVKPLLFEAVLHCQVIGAYTAVHATGGNKLFVHTT